MLEQLSVGASITPKTSGRRPLASSDSSQTPNCDNHPLREIGSSAPALCGGTRRCP